MGEVTSATPALRRPPPALHGARASLLVRMVGLVVVLKGVALLGEGAYYLKYLSDQNAWRGISTEVEARVRVGGNRFVEYWTLGASVVWNIECLLEGVLLIALGAWMWSRYGQQFVSRRIARHEK